MALAKLGNAGKELSLADAGRRLADAGRRWPTPEDEPEWDQATVVLDWYNSDLNLVICKTGFLSASPLTDGGFAFMWAGARASYGFVKGKVCYEVKVRSLSFSL